MRWADASGVGPALRGAAGELLLAQQGAVLATSSVHRCGVDCERWEWAAEKHLLDGPDVHDAGAVLAEPGTGARWPADVRLPD